MTLPQDYLEYPLRRHGMDHDWYPWRNHFSIPAHAWPNGARLAGAPPKKSTCHWQTRARSAASRVASNGA